MSGSEPKTINKEPDEPTRYVVTCESCPGRSTPGQYRCIAEVWGIAVGASAGKPFAGSGWKTGQCTGSPPGKMLVEVFFNDTHQRVPWNQAPGTASYSCRCTRGIAEAKEGDTCKQAPGAPVRYEVEVGEPPKKPNHKAYALHVVVVDSGGQVIGTCTELIGWPSALPRVVVVPADAGRTGAPRDARYWWWWLPLAEPEAAP